MMGLLFYFRRTDFLLLAKIENEVVYTMAGSPPLSEFECSAQVLLELLRVYFNQTKSYTSDDFESCFSFRR